MLALPDRLGGRFNWIQEAVGFVKGKSLESSEIPGKKIKVIIEGGNYQDWSRVSYVAPVERMIPEGTTAVTYFDKDRLILIGRWQDDTIHVVTEEDRQGGKTVEIEVGMLPFEGLHKARTVITERGEVFFSERLIERSGFEYLEKFLRTMQETYGPTNPVASIWLKLPPAR